MRQQRMCRDLKKKSALSEVLRFGHEAAVHLLDLYQDEEDLHNVLDPPPIACMYFYSYSFYVSQ